MGKNPFRRLMIPTVPTTKTVYNIYAVERTVMPKELTAIQRRGGPLTTDSTNATVTLAQIGSTFTTVCKIWCGRWHTVM